MIQFNREDYINGIAEALLIDLEEMKCLKSMRFFPAKTLYHYLKTLEIKKKEEKNV